MHSLTFHTLFDLDGTMFDNNRYHIDAWHRLFEEQGHPLSARQFESLMGRTAVEAVRQVMGAELEDREVQALVDQKEAIYRDLYKPHIQAHGGLLELLAELRRHACGIGLVTSAPPENIDLLLDESGLRPYFEVLVNGLEVSRGKPDPACYLLGAERLRVQPETCVVFEDATVGVEAARAAGMKVIGVSAQHPKEALPGTILHIPDFQDLTVRRIQEAIRAYS